MSKIKDNNFYLVYGWMLNELKLSGLELQVYAIIYGFSQDGVNKYRGSLQYLADFTNKTKRSIITALQKLVESGLILKTDIYDNNIKYCEYAVNQNVLSSENISRGGEDISLGVVKKLHGGSEKTSPNNILNNINNNINILEDTPKTTQHKSVKYLLSLSLEEQYKLVEDYAREQALSFDVRYFVDWWSARNWTPKGRSKQLSDWQATARNWARREQSYSQQQATGASIYGNENDCANMYAHIWDNQTLDIFKKKN